MRKLHNLMHVISMQNHGAAIMLSSSGSSLYADGYPATSVLVGFQKFESGISLITTSAL